MCVVYLIDPCCNESWDIHLIWLSRIYVWWFPTLCEAAIQPCLNITIIRSVRVCVSNCCVQHTMYLVSSVFLLLFDYLDDLLWCQHYVTPYYIVNTSIEMKEMMVFRPLLCTLLRLNWAKQTPRIVNNYIMASNLLLTVSQNKLRL